MAWKEIYDLLNSPLHLNDPLDRIFSANTRYTKFYAIQRAHNIILAEILRQVDAEYGVIYQDYTTSTTPGIKKLNNLWTLPIPKNCLSFYDLRYVESDGNEGIQIVPVDARAQFDGGYNIFPQGAGIILPDQPSQTIRLKYHAIPAPVFLSTVGAPVSTTSFVVNSATVLGSISTDVDAYIGYAISLKNKTNNLVEERRVSDFNGASYAITVDTAFSWSPAADEVVELVPMVPAYLHGYIVEYAEALILKDKKAESMLRMRIMSAAGPRSFLTNKKVRSTGSVRSS